MICLLVLCSVASVRGDCAVLTGVFMGCGILAGGGGDTGCGSSVKKVPLPLVLHNLSLHCFDSPYVMTPIC
jgi:hypothetical protein